MPGVKRPRRGSLAYYPRKRAKRIYPVLTTYPETDKVKILGFAGYKAGMTNVIMVDNRKGSPSFGQEIVTAVTVLDCPPLKVLGMRSYEKTVNGLRILGESWIKDLPKDIKRKIGNEPKENLAKMEKILDKISIIRLIISTQPRLSAMGKKKPELFELEIGGKDAKEKFEFGKSLLGKEVSAKDIIKEGELVDVIAVTKGKGFAGPVKRFGVGIQNRHAKKKLRHIGTLGPETPARVLWTVPQAGQLGFQTRTEMNKRILKIGEKGEEVTPRQGIKRYGVIKSNYVILDGSVPGPKKRLIFLRSPIRSSKVKVLLQDIREIIK